MNDQHDSIGAAASKCIALIAAWLGTITVAQVQTSIAILSGLAVLIYTILNTYYLIRRNRKGSHEND